MKAIRMLSVLGLAVAGLLAAGCSEKYSITVTNACNDIQSVTITDSGGFPLIDDLAVSANGGRGTCTIKQDEDASLGYVIKTNKFSKEFVISKRGPNPMYFLVTPNGITGPFEKEAKVSEKWDDSKTEQIHRGMKVE